MDANKALISNIFNGFTVVEVPFFQRSYVWGDDLWARFLEDMEFIVKTRKPHFFGSIILKRGKAPQPGDLFTERWTIVDGQQRLTTYLIFMKVLCLKSGQPALFDHLFRIVGTFIALRHGKNDVTAFERVMAMETAEKISDQGQSSRVIDAYNYFMDNVNPEKLNITFINANAQFVRIDLLQDEDEQQIFDTINSLGVNLTTSELLKNYFFSRENVTEYENRWANVFEKDEETKQYWDTEIEAGRIKRAMIDIFFDAYFQIFIQNKAFNISNEDKISYARLDNLAQSYQHFITTYCGGDREVVLSQMKDYAMCFRRSFQPEQCNMSIPKSFGIERMNIVIFGLKNTTLIPYVLYLAKNVTDENELNKIYGILESYIMRRIVVHATTKNYNNLFTSLVLNNVVTADTLLQKLIEGNDSTTYIPGKDELRRGFEYSKLINLQSKGIIYMIESKIRPTGSSTALLGFEQYSLEHLMPKKWRNNWEPCPSDEAARNRDSIILTLGNLAIITQSLNASIRDASWAMKKTGKGAKPGLNVCASGLVTLFDVLTLDKWDEQSISVRADWLYQKAEEVWNMGDLPEGSSAHPISSSDEQDEPETRLSENEIIETAVTRVSGSIEQNLIPIKGRSYKTSDSGKGFVFAYSNGRLENQRWKYWYRYQTEMMVNIADCEEKYLALFCVANDEIYVLPMEYLEQAKASMNFTSDENDEPKYWHVVLYKSETGKMIHLLSRPTLREVDIAHYKL